MFFISFFRFFYFFYYYATDKSARGGRPRATKNENPARQGQLSAGSWWFMTTTSREFHPFHSQAESSSTNTHSRRVSEYLQAVPHERLFFRTTAKSYWGLPTHNRFTSILYHKTVYLSSVFRNFLKKIFLIYQLNGAIDFSVIFFKI